MTGPISCDLAANALDYLLLAGQMAKERTPRMWKHALATLADGVELLLKARLEIYDWSLLFSDVDKADRASFESGDFKSVRPDQATKRLKDICAVEVDAKALGTLGALRLLRNKIRHFAVTVDEEEAVSLIAKAYTFTIDFAAAHLEEHLKGEARADLASLRGLLGEFGEFVTVRLTQIQSKLDGQDYAIHVECPRCLQETLYADGGSASCAFCGYSAEGEVAAQACLDHRFGYLRLKDRMIEGVDAPMSCPECGCSAAIPYGEDFEEGVSCLSCGETSLLKACERCGNPTYGDCCAYCLYVMAKDD